MDSKILEISGTIYDPVWKRLEEGFDELS
jgi:hypothetical protein